ncbi:cyclopropane-fatty-acyl-phospholipid synthase family protein [Nonomuraea sp. MG754425]|uniref:SAM-dependent methyltransferase n=1 Tax=Nonomuraea sp. MG754425 TaxID=2570319 RepID=UPI001F442DB8|nr:class I SAM-dependent methyltransferase [Nonomuraea sp. MG754425]
MRRRVAPPRRPRRPGRGGRVTGAASFVFGELRAVNARPGVFSVVTTPELWTDEHISGRMLAAHLDPHLDSASNRIDVVERVSAWLVDRFDLRDGRRVADFGCGPGLYTGRIARTGARVTGLDLSRRSLDHAVTAAREDGRTIRYLCQDYLSYRDAERYDLVLMVMRDYCALAPAARRALLRTVREHLADGGAFAFDVDAPPAFDAVEERAVYAPSLMDGFWSARPYFGFHNTFRYERARVSLDKYEIVEEERRRTFYNWVRYFTPAELTAELNGAGFTAVDILGDLTGARYDPGAPLFAAVARTGSG